MSTDASPIPKPPLILLFDGDCGLCNWSVNFILTRDQDRRFRFAPQQSAFAQDLLAKHGLEADEINSMVLVDGDNIYLRSNAALRIVMDLPEPWPLLGVLVYIPETLRNTVYDFIARHRKQWFNSPDACRRPTPEEQEQFLA